MSQSAGPSAANLSALVDGERLAGRLSELVRIDSQNPPGNEAGAAEAVERFCHELGLETSSHEAALGRPNVVARRAFSDGPAVAFCSHIDTVPIGDRASWDRDPLGAEVVDGIMWGRGSCDAKGSIAAALEAVAVLIESGAPLHGTLELALVSDEETMGFKGAGHLLEQGVLAPDVAIVGEPTSLRLVRAQRGACWLDLTTRGRAAHGSAPERGVNAIVHMTEILRHLPATLPDVGHELLGGPSLNVGTMTGGEKVNMVPALCRVEIDRRTVPGEDAESVLKGVRGAIEQARIAHPDIDAEVSLGFFAAPFEIDEGARVVTEVSGALAEATGRPAKLMGFRGASDARFFAARGTEVVVCGPGDIAVAHTVREHLSLEELRVAAIAYALAFARLLSAAS